MAGMRQLLDRKDAVSNICKVTGTMEMISTSRYKQYYDSWAGSVGYFDSLAQLAYLIVTAQQGIDHPLMKENESRSQAIIASGSNRGLCGAYNSNLCKLVEVHVKMAKRFHRELKIFVQ